MIKTAFHLVRKGQRLLSKDSRKQEVVRRKITSVEKHLGPPVLCQHSATYRRKYGTTRERLVLSVVSDDQKK